VVVATCPVPVRMLGIPGVFAPTGSAAFLLEHFGLTAAAIEQAALELVRGREAA
jgi:transketolase